MTTKLRQNYENTFNKKVSDCMINSICTFVNGYDCSVWNMKKGHFSHINIVINKNIEGEFKKGDRILLFEIILTTTSETNEYMTLTFDYPEHMDPKICLEQITYYLKNKNPIDYFRDKRIDTCLYCNNLFKNLPKCMLCCNCKCNYAERYKLLEDRLTENWNDRGISKEELKLIKDNVNRQVRILNLRYFKNEFVEGLNDV